MGIYYAKGEQTPIDFIDSVCIIIIKILHASLGALYSLNSFHMQLQCKPNICFERKLNPVQCMPRRTKCYL